MKSNAKPSPKIAGIDIDAEGRCRHWHADHDVLAIRFSCCQRWFACHACHQALSDHPSLRWQTHSFHARALMCGRCGKTFTIGSYLKGINRCPHCMGAFNPGCAHHHHLYFAPTRSTRHAIP